ncbi:MAG: molybdopterin-dependent oxidoreductase [Thermodesulfobacteriota bacterium]
MQVHQQSIICTGCGCLCDDLDATLDQGQLLEVANVCLWGLSRFFPIKRLHPQKERHRLSEPLSRVNGHLQEVSYTTALEQAAEILGQARRPLIYGLTNTGSWAQQAALQLARKIKARLEPADLAFKAPYYQSLKKHGLYWAPLEVIRDEADTVLFWGANPLHSCPRHLVRYSVFARGRFTERGVEDRQVAAVDLYQTELAKFCHLLVQIEPGQGLDLLKGIGEHLPGGSGARSAVKGARKLAKFLSQAEFGVIFFGRGATYNQGFDVLDALGGLAARLGERQTWALFPLTGDFNSQGLYHLLLNEVGVPEAPDFGHENGLLTSATPVDFEEFDAILVLGADLFWFLPEDQALALQKRQVPVVSLSPFANRTTSCSQVVLPTALAGLETMEVAYRMDGLPLVLKKLLPTALPGDQDILLDLIQAI